MYRIMIVDNDPMVSFIHREYVERDARFEVAGEFRTGRDALAFLENNHADLMISDICLPEYSGISLLKDIVEKGINTDVLLITAAKDSESLRAALHLGVIDYLIKPFSYERLRQALDRYAVYAGAMKGLRLVDEETAAYLLHPGERSSARPAKGDGRAAEARIMECFECAPEHGFTAKELAGRIELSAVTVRRHLKRLIGTGRVLGDVDYNTGGHPGVVYRLP